MSKFDIIKQQFLSNGIKQENIDYAVDAVKNGTKREFILENLTADYRGMSQAEAVPLIEALFAANGGEFKKENSGGYLYGGALLFAGLLLAFYIGYVAFFGGVLVRPVFVVSGAALCLGLGAKLLYKAMRGKYRDADEPFRRSDWS
jgi:hypothetical protein